MRRPRLLWNAFWGGFAVRTMLISAGIVLLALCPSAGAWQFAVVSDSQIHLSSSNLARVGETAQALAQEDIALVIFPGDVVLDGDYDTMMARYRKWQELFMDPLRDAGIGVYPVRGNHDALPSAWRDAFSGDYALPNNGPAGEVGQTYAFTHEDALFLALDELPTSAKKYSVNQRWLDAQLKANDKPNVFVFGHYPAFAMYKIESLALRPLPRDLFWQSLGRAHAAYFCGHNHFFDHAAASDWFGRRVPHVVAGTSSDHIHEWNGSFLNRRVRRYEHVEAYGYTIVSVSGSTKTITFKQYTGPGTFETVYENTLLPR